MSRSEPLWEMAALPASKALVRRLVEEGVNGGHLKVVEEVLAPNYPSLLPGSSGPASVKKLLSSYREAVPDAHWIITAQVAESETVVTCTATDSDNTNSPVSQSFTVYVDTNLSGYSTMSNVNLKGAYLWWWDLSGDDLSDCNFSGATFSYANLPHGRRLGQHEMPGRH